MGVKFGQRCCEHPFIIERQFQGLKGGFLVFLHCVSSGGNGPPFPICVLCAVALGRH